MKKSILAITCLVSSTVLIAQRYQDVLTQTIAININDKIVVTNTETDKPFSNKCYIQGYHSESGKLRITSKILTNDEDNTSGFLQKLDPYRHIIGIDSNTIEYEHPIFASPIKVSLGIGIVLDIKDDTWQFHPIERAFYPAFNSPKPENENWIAVIEHMKKSCNCSDPRKMALIVDSDLGMLNQYNRHEGPIFGDYFLPEDVELIFASDKLSDNVFNKLVRECHSLAKEMLSVFVRRLTEQYDAAVHSVHADSPPSDHIQPE